MKITTLPDGARGFDCNRRLSGADCADFRALGYTFAVRYVVRTTTHSYDLSVSERDVILGSGLALMVVQHVAPEGWHPTAALGTQYGQTAASECGLLGLPDGMTLWCDLEGVAPGTPAAEVIGYGNAWYDAVGALGFVPGLYVGWHAGLGPHDLYHALRFAAYWSAYNLDADAVPAVRGVQMQQSVATAADVPVGWAPNTIDVDMITADALGGTPSLVVSDTTPPGGA